MHNTTGGEVVATVTLVENEELRRLMLDSLANTGRRSSHAGGDRRGSRAGMGRQSIVVDAPSPLAEFEAAARLSTARMSASHQAAAALAAGRLSTKSGPRATSAVGAPAEGTSGAEQAQHLGDAASGAPAPAEKQRDRKGALAPTTLDEIWSNIEQTRRTAEAQHRRTSLEAGGAGSPGPGGTLNPAPGRIGGTLDPARRSSLEARRASLERRWDGAPSGGGRGHPAVDRLPPIADSVETVVMNNRNPSTTDTAMSTSLGSSSHVARMGLNDGGGAAASPPRGKLETPVLPTQPSAGMPQPLARRASAHRDPTEQVYVKIEVRDNGCGIPEAAHKLLLKPFSQVMPSSNAHEIEGTGIGLALVKLLCDAMGGTITFVSQEGRGSRFTVVAPLKRATPAANHHLAGRGGASWAGGGGGLASSASVPVNASPWARFEQQQASKQAQRAAEKKAQRHAEMLAVAGAAGDSEDTVVSSEEGGAAPASRSDSRAIVYVHTAEHPGSVPEDEEGDGAAKVASTTRSGARHNSERAGTASTGVPPGWSAAASGGSVKDLSKNGAAANGRGGPLRLALPENTRVVVPIQKDVLREGVLHMLSCVDINAAARPVPRLEQSHRNSSTGDAEAQGSRLLPISGVAFEGLLRRRSGASEHRDSDGQNDAERSIIMPSMNLVAVMEATALTDLLRLVGNPGLFGLSEFLRDCGVCAFFADGSAPADTSSRRTRRCSQRRSPCASSSSFTTASRRTRSSPPQPRLLVGHRHHPPEAPSSQSPRRSSSCSCRRSPRRSGPPFPPRRGARRLRPCCRRASRQPS